MSMEYLLNSRWLTICLICIMCLLTGCSSDPLVRGYVTPKSVCCAKIEEFKFHTMPLGQEHFFKISSESPTHQFSAGRYEHFAAFRIPDGFAVAAIQSRSHLSTDFLPKATALFPDFIFFDSNYRQIGRANVKALQERGSFWGAALGATVAVPQGVRYFVVVAGNGDGSNQYRSENGVVHQIPAAALGKLSLRLFGEQIGTAEAK